MSPRDNIEKNIKQFDIDINPNRDEAIFNQLQEAMSKTKQPKPDARYEIWRIIMENRTTKLTTVAAVLIAGMIIFSLTVSPKVTFADVIRPIFEAKTFSYDLLVGGEDRPYARDYVSSNRIRRSVSHAPDIVLIIDTDAAKILHLDTAGKTASLVNIAGPLERQARNFIALIRETIERQMADPNFQPQVQFKREIDGRKVIDYSIGGDGDRVTILADAKTGLPVQIELEWGREAFILKNFEFNIPISEDDVSMDPPAGYTMRQTQMDFSNLSENDLIESLRVWVTYLRDDGTFPPELLKQEYIKQIPFLQQAIGGLSIPDPEKEQLGTYFIQGMLFMQILNEMEWHYAGTGVHLGDSETAIIWYRPKGTDSYRVIYGDLSVKEVATENLPK